MYAYKVYDFDYEDTESFVLFHEKKSTKEDYENTLNSCRKKVCSKIRRNQKILEKVENISDERAEDLELLSCSFEEHIMDNMKKMLISDYGFKEINIEYTFAVHDDSYIKGRVIENKVIC